MIHTVQLSGKSAARPFCGPYALAAVLGITYAEACRRIKAGRKKRGKPVPRQIKSTWDEEIGRILGADWIDQGPPEMTFARFLSLLTDRETYIVRLTGHYVAISDGQFIDNVTRRRRLLKNAPLKRSTVRGYWKHIGGVNG